MTTKLTASLNDSGKIDLILENQEAILDNQKLILANQEDIIEKLNDINEGRDYDVDERAY